MDKKTKKIIVVIIVAVISVVCAVLGVSLGVPLDALIPIGTEIVDELSACEQVEEVASVLSQTFVPPFATI